MRVGHRCCMYCLVSVRFGLTMSGIRVPSYRSRSQQDPIVRCLSWAMTSPPAVSFSGEWPVWPWEFRVSLLPLSSFVGVFVPHMAPTYFQSSSVTAEVPLFLSQYLPSLRPCRRGIRGKLVQ